MGELLADRDYRPRIPPILDAIDRGYSSRRRALLGSQEQEAEAARQRTKARLGFERLDDDQVHRGTAGILAVHHLSVPP